MIFTPIPSTSYIFPSFFLPSRFGAYSRDSMRFVCTFTSGRPNTDALSSTDRSGIFVFIATAPTTNATIENAATPIRA